MKCSIISDRIKTRQGMIQIESIADPDRLQDLIMSSDLAVHERYKSIFTRKASLERILGKKGRVAIALLDQTTIVGYAALDYPDSNDRWATLGEQAIMELKAVEVSRQIRKHGLAKRLLSTLLTDPGLERKIIYLSAYSWTWDLDYSGLTAESYREILITLYKDFGFKEYPTNEPNICLAPENIFMARVGENVSQQIREEFKWMRFGISI